MMSTCHGLYSLSGVISAGLTVVFFSAGFSSNRMIEFILVIIFTILFLNRHHLLSHTEIIHSGSGLKFPTASIPGISFICMVVFMAEGCVADRGALYLKESLHIPHQFIGLGYGGFAVAMTIGRFNGDVIIAKAGNKKNVIMGTLLAVTGFILVVLAPFPAIAIMGYICIGFGYYCIIPVLFGASAGIPGVSKVEGFAMGTSGGLIGFLTGLHLLVLFQKNLI
jgi:hypothetical protein